MYIIRLVALLYQLVLKDYSGSCQFFLSLRRRTTLACVVEAETAR
jgi:hypothetical protein